MNRARVLDEAEGAGTNSSEWPPDAEDIAIADAERAAARGELGFTTLEAVKDADGKILGATMKFRTLAELRLAGDLQDVLGVLPYHHHHHDADGSDGGGATEK